METGDSAADEHQLERLEEVLWVVEAQEGNSDAFARLMNRYEKRLLYFLRRMVPEGDWALDLHQEVWIEAFRGLPHCRCRRPFGCGFTASPSTKRPDLFVIRSSGKKLPGM